MTSEQLEARRKLITGTRIGPICGHPFYFTAFDVWADMKGFTQPAEPSPEMLLGVDLEQAIVLNCYPRLTGRKTTWGNELVRHPTIPFLAATPDGYTPGRVVDSKVVNYFQRHHWGATIDEIPGAIQTQIMLQMEVCGCEAGDVIALIGSETRVYPMQRDREAAAAMIAIAAHWYRTFIEGDAIPPVPGSDRAARALQQMFPRNKRPLRSATSKEQDLLIDLAVQRRKEREAVTRKDQLENLLRLAIGDADGLEWPSGKLTWKKAKDTEKIDWQSMALALLTHYVKDETARKKLLEDYTRVTPGARRLRFDSRLLKEDAEEEAHAGSAA